jgi:hypothetical protein
MTIDRTNAELEADLRRSLRGRRFLTKGSGNGHGYVAQPKREYPAVADEPDVLERIASATALADEPEAPSSAWVDAEAELAAERNRLRHLAVVAQRIEIRRELTVEARIRDVQRRAKDQRVDISGELYVIRKMRSRSQRAGHTKEPPAAMRRLEAVEARLDGVSKP